jgi:hypothetical protein
MIAARPLALTAAALLIASSLAACDGCSKSAVPPKEPEVTKPPDPPKEEPKPPEDPLKEAREDAEKQAGAAALAIQDACALVGADIEGMHVKPTTVQPTTTKIKQLETGTIDSKDATKVFRDYDGGMKKCYERTLKKNPGLEGQVILTLIVNPDGKVKTARASGSLDNKEVETCIERLAMEMVFPKPDGGAARLVKPYKFHPDI